MEEELAQLVGGSLRPRNERTLYEALVRVWSRVRKDEKSDDDDWRDVVVAGVMALLAREDVLLVVVLGEDGEKKERCHESINVLVWFIAARLVNARREGEKERAIARGCGMAQQGWLALAKRELEFALSSDTVLQSGIEAGRFLGAIFGEQKNEAEIVRSSCLPVMVGLVAKHKGEKGGSMEFVIFRNALRGVCSAARLKLCRAKIKEECPWLSSLCEELMNHSVKEISLLATLTSFLIFSLDESGVVDVIQNLSRLEADVARIEDIGIEVEARKMLEKVLESGEGVELNRGKIMMVGPGRVGKTATVRSLLKKQFDPNLEPTLGIDASLTCSVNRNGKVVNWAETEKESEFVKHAVMTVEKRMKELGEGDQENNGAQIRRSTLLQKIINRQSSRYSMSSTRGRIGSFSSESNVDPRRMNADSFPIDVSSKEGGTRRDSVIQRVTKGVSNAISVLTGSGLAMAPKISQEAIPIRNDKVAMAMRDKITKKIIESNGDINIKLSIWDLGGHEMFNALHYLFLTRHSIYLYVFDMRAILSADEKERISSMNSITLWLKSIRMHGPKASVFLIGTFKDVVSKPNQFAEIDSALSSSLSNLVSMLVLNEQEKLTFWPIDNTKSGDDPVVVRLRETILDHVAKMEGISVKVPLAWTLILHKLIATKQRSVTMREVLSISSQSHVTSRVHITAMLNLFHELGMILHLSGDLIILDPQWLFHALTMVIRDFKLHPFPDQLGSDILLDFATEFKQLKNEFLISVRLLNRLWSAEDGDSKIDFTRRKFLISLMENMSLSCAWRSEEEYAESDGEIEMRNLPPPKQYFLPCYSHMIDSREAGFKIRAQIDQKYPKASLVKSSTLRSNGDGGTCFVVDFSLSFLPFGFFDHLICLLVEHSSLTFRGSRKPIVLDGTAILSLGLNVFRLDEDTEMRRIVVTMIANPDHRLILATIESILAKLKHETNTEVPLQYRILVMVGVDANLVDIGKARETLVKKRNGTLRDVVDQVVKGEAVSQWIFGDDEEEKKISQSMPSGRSNHVFIINSFDASPDTTQMLQKELADRGVKVSSAKTSPSSSMKKGIDSAACVILLLTENVFEDDSVQETLRYVFGAKREKFAVILTQEGGGDANAIFDRAPSDIQAMFSNFHDPIILKPWYHEKIAFMKELVNTINAKCEELMSVIPTQYLAFLSHVKKDAGPTATLLLTMLHARLKETGEKGVIFLDCDQLIDLRRLPDQVKSSRVLVAMLTEFYLTRPWCLLELHTAIENNIPMIAVNVARGGHDFEKAAAFLETLSPETLDERNKGASATLEKLDINVTELGKKLYAVLPNLKTINFDPSEALRVRNNQLEMILSVILEETSGKR